MLIKDALAVILRDLDRLIGILADLTRKYRHTLCVGRTFGQHEGPITFGYKTTAWAMELHHCKRLLIDGQRDYLIGKATGTIGNLSSLEKFYPGKALSFEQKVCRNSDYTESDLTRSFPSPAEADRGEPDLCRQRHRQHRHGNLQPPEA